MHYLWVLWIPILIIRITLTVILCQTSRVPLDLTSNQLENTQGICCDSKLKIIKYNFGS